MPTKHRSLFRSFLSYYRGQRHLFVIDIIAAVTVAAIDLAFPQILRSLTGGLFTEGPDAIMGALAYLAVGLVCMYALRFVCRYFVIFWGHVMGARMESRMREDLFDAYEHGEPHARGPLRRLRAHELLVLRPPQVGRPHEPPGLRPL